MDLFDFINAMFDGAAYQAVGEADKRKNYFMALRMLSIQYPVEACEFSLVAINKEKTMDFWAMFLRRTFIHKPKWLYTKVRKKEVPPKGSVHKVYEVKPDLVSEWQDMFGIGQGDYELLREIDPDGLLGELKILEGRHKDSNAAE